MYHCTFCFVCLLIWTNIQAQEVQNPHQEPTHNFTVQRLIIVNDQDEMLMAREDYVWAPPSAVFMKRQFVNEGMDSLANVYGIKIKALQLRGYFSYKYDYHPYATMRAYYVAEFESGAIQVPPGMDEVKWMPIDEALEISTVAAIKESTIQIMQHPNTIWGASFLVSDTGDAHPTKRVEDFYPLFELK